MLTPTRCGDDDLTSSTNEERETSQAVGEPIESFPPGSGATVSGGLGSSSGSDLDAWEVTVSKMTRSAVSVLLLDGDTNVFTCSGIPLQCNQSYIRVLTSPNLAIAMRNKQKVGSTMRIRVRDAFNNIAPGCLEHRELDNGTAFVRIMQFLNVSEVNLHHGVEFQPNSDLVISIQLTGSGGATPVKGLLTKDSIASEGDEVLCKAGDGGPLFDGDGNFVGMNLCCDKGRCTFVQRSVIVEQLKQLEKRNELRARRAGSFRPIVGTGERRLRQENYVLL